MDTTQWEDSLRQRGYAPCGPLLDAAACAELRQMYDRPERFRSRVVMERYRFGRGEYQYLDHPLPEIVTRLRREIYTALAPAATRWMHDLDSPVTFPATHAGFLETCHSAGQTRPAPLLLRYRTGDYNCLHQDLYGDVVFPFQVVIGLSRPGEDYTGGELLLVEQRPRAQSLARVIPLAQGEGAIITTRYRPVPGSRGFYRANVKHGVSEVLSGNRFTLGIIFHDAR